TQPAQLFVFQVASGDSPHGKRKVIHQPANSVDATFPRYPDGPPEAYHRHDWEGETFTKKRFAEDLPILQIGRHWPEKNIAPKAPSIRPAALTVSEM
ncbi:MAG: hypothetical protein FWF29_11570, partial [Treponema sp.]|nr:hypothetical protein [Treponema sp.]